MHDPSSSSDPRAGGGEGDARARFEALLGFAPDPFQTRALDALDAGRSVLVAAPTGAGKTVVGEYGCHLALGASGRSFYTTPIKALSNQKLRDLRQRHGAEAVGLLTGDRVVDAGAPIVVMTTEVLRNMIYEASPALGDLRTVVLDEVHYLADRERGAVWEEVIIQLPQHVQLVALSATVSNAEDVGRWLAEVRGGCDVIVEEHRPVPLRHHYYVNDRVYSTFRSSKSGKGGRERREAAAQARGGVPNPDVLMLERRAATRNRVSGRGRRQASDVRLRWPDRPTVVDELARRRWLPAILFVFSRRGCDQAVEQLVRAGLRLTTPAQRAEIGVLLDTLLGDLPAADLAVLGYPRFRAALMDGIAPHHAGMVPAFKEAVEVCFQRGLLGVVVATETLALGINMPARTVVIERLEKWDGERHVLLTPGQYTQLTGRAGRRGIDDIGHAVVLYQRDLDFRTVAGLVGTRTYPLSSSFAPSYNMAVNLLRRHRLDDARALIERSFAQFQADAGTAALVAEREEALAGLRGYEPHLACDRGDWAAYWELRRELSRTEKRTAGERRRRLRERIEHGVAALDPGDVVVVPGVGRRGLVAVATTTVSGSGTPLAQVVTDARSLQRIGPRELDAPPDVVGRVRLPRKGNPRQREYRAEVASQLRALDEPTTARHAPDGDEQVAGQGRVAELRAAMRAHPCHTCPDRDEHERWQHRADALAERADRARIRIERQTGSLSRQLDRILQVLGELGYVDAAPAPTEAGLVLAGVYADVDLLVAEAVRRGLLDGLDGPTLAAVASLATYTPRGGDRTTDPEWPSRVVLEVAEDLDDLATELRRHETRVGLAPMRDLDPGFAAPVWRWAHGDDLDDALGGLDLTGGDFVRNVKQVADLVGQLRHVGDPQLRSTAEDALDALRRGIVEA